MSSSDTTKFYVETGNWRASVILPVKKSEVSNYDYIEAATIAIECVFNEKKNISKNFEILKITDKSGRDYFDAEYEGDLSDVPESLFGLLTACFMEKDMNRQENWWYFLTSKIFANAAQHQNVSLATEVEKKYSKEVNEFKLREEELIELNNSGDLEKTLEDAKKRLKKKPKKQNPPDENDSKK
jgi:hypothetical protein